MGFTPGMARGVACLRHAHSPVVIFHPTLAQKAGLHPRHGQRRCSPQTLPLTCSDFPPNPGAEGWAPPQAWPEALLASDTPTHLLRFSTQPWRRRLGSTPGMARGVACLRHNHSPVVVFHPALGQKDGLHPRHGQRRCSPQTLPLTCSDFPPSPGAEGWAPPQAWPEALLASDTPTHL
jgi:hypothetical protein